MPSAADVAAALTDYPTHRAADALAGKSWAILSPSIVCPPGPRNLFRLSFIHPRTAGFIPAFIHSFIHSLIHPQPPTSDLRPPTPDPRPLTSDLPPRHKSSSGLVISPRIARASCT